MDASQNVWMWPKVVLLINSAKFPLISTSLSYSCKFVIQLQTLLAVIVLDNAISQLQWSGSTAFYYSMIFTQISPLLPPHLDMFGHKWVICTLSVSYFVLDYFHIQLFYFILFFKGYLICLLGQNTPSIVLLILLLSEHW